MKKAASKAKAKAKAKASAKKGAAKPKAKAKAGAKKTAKPKAKAGAKKTAKPKAKAGAKKTAATPKAKAGAKRTAATPKAGAKKTAATPKAKASPKKSAPPKETVTGLREGDPAPDFSLPDQHGNVVSSALLAGQPYVLYFYPKDDTPGCTREACGFRDDLGKFTGAGARVLGVSPDTETSHSRFAQKYGLSFPLLSDAEKTLAKAYGVWVMKQNYGREYMGIERSTFVVGGDGRIKKAFRRVKVDGHVPAVFAAL